MKLREDFVSNSSSSSYVVRAFDGMPDVFAKGELLNFSQYADRFLKRDVVGGLEYHCTWHSTPVETIRSMLKTYSKEDFARRYVEGGDRRLENAIIVLDSDSDLLEEAFELTGILRSYDNPAIEIYTAGRRNVELEGAARGAVYDEQQRVAGDRLDEVFDKMTLRFRQALCGAMGTWKFRYVELDDGDSADGEDALRECGWGRVFDNH